MENQNVQVLASLIKDRDFAEAMDKDVDQALQNAGFNVDPAFAGQLKNYGKTKGFADIANSKISDVNDTMSSAFGIDSRW